MHYGDVVARRTVAVSLLSAVSDSAGTVYVTDLFNHSIRAISETATTTIAGNRLNEASVDATGTAAGFAAPREMALDEGRGILYVTDGGALRKIELATRAVSTVALSNTVGGARGLYFDSTANALYLAETNRHAISVVDLATNNMTVIAGTRGVPGNTDGRGAAAGFRAPTHVVGDGAGNLYVSDYDNHTIRRIALATKEVTTVAGQAQVPGALDGVGAAALFNHPWGLAWNPTNSVLYIVDENNFALRAYNPTSQAVSTVAGKAGESAFVDGALASARFQAPSAVVYRGGVGMAIGDGPTLRQVAGNSITTVSGVAPTAGAVDGPTASALFKYPNGLAVDGTRVYVADWGNSTIRSIDMSTGSVTTFAGAAGQSGKLDGLGGTPASRTSRTSPSTGRATSSRPTALRARSGRSSWRQARSLSSPARRWCRGPSTASGPPRGSNIPGEWPPTATISM